METSVKVFLVGGAVRDEILGVPNKDEDFAVELPSMDAMLAWLADEGFKVFKVDESTLTARAKFPEGDSRGFDGTTADFVLCRKDGAYGDGRRPDTVTPGTIFDDLARRDFTMNAIAKDITTGEILDPFGGREDIARGLVTCVGLAKDRFSEDSLRAIRALRFALVKGMDLSEDIRAALSSDWLPPLLVSVSKDRRWEELGKMFKSNSVASMRLLLDLCPPALLDALFADGLWLMPTLKQ